MGQIVPVFRPDGDGGVSSILIDTIGNFTANWMYTALVEGIFDGPQPSWSKDSWSFVPLDLSKVPSPRMDGQSKKNEDASGFSNRYSTANLTFQTTAVRGSIECSHIQEGDDPRQWLSIINNHTELQEQGLADDDTMFLTNITIFPETDYRTTFVSGLTAPKCCRNGSITTGSDRSLSPVALGYWTMNFPSDLNANQSALYGKSGNFTIKWVTGIGDLYNSSDYESKDTLYFSKKPMIQALNCRPLIESAAAVVTVDHVRAQVQHYQILEGAQPEDVAWSDAFELRDETLDNSSGPECEKGCMGNVTIR
jgi:hypothetical protein